MTQPMEGDENTPIDGGLTAKRVKTLSQDQLKSIIDECEKYELKVGDKWYVVSNTWWSKVIQASTKGFAEDVPPIDCSNISSKSGNNFYLRQKLAEFIDYQLVPRSTFVRFKECYGIADEDRDIIEREVVRNEKKVTVEVYPRVLSVSLARDKNKRVDMHLTQNDTMETIRDNVLEKLDLTNTPEDKLRFYIVHSNGTNELIDLTTKSINDYFDTAHDVVVDVDDESGWFVCEKPKASSFSFRLLNAWHNLVHSLTNWRWLLSLVLSMLFRKPIRFYLSDRVIARYPKGVCGLNNLGNTCFMASAIQCLSNIPPIRDYFVSGEYRKDINISNPLGTKGELALAYGELMKMMWSGENSSVAPRKLKSTIGQFAPRFSGYAQQDSQELLAYLLDGLHEDLNRVKEKPYLQDNENMDKMEEHLKARTSWQIYKARNDSIIVDKVHGQLKSTLVCPVCALVSIKFDPFCFLSVPLPPKERCTNLNVTLIYTTVPKKKWAKFSLSVTRGTRAHNVIQIMSHKLSELNSQAAPQNIVLYSVIGDSSGDVKIFGSDECIWIDEPLRDIYAICVDAPADIGTFFVIKNVTQSARPLSLPTVFCVSEPLSIEFISERIIGFTRESFHVNKDAMNTTNGDDSMDGTSEPCYTLWVDLPTKGTQVAEFDEEGNLKLPPEHFKPVTLNFKWKDQKLFNNYRGVELIEQECKSQESKEVNIMDCIDLFTKREQLGEDDSWYCPSCKKHERATKQLELWSLPEILIIHLKRFHYTRISRDKIDVPVRIPVSGFELNSKLANEKHEHVMYDLIAISHHMGGLGGGHYTATALNSTTKKWYDFNDSCTSPTTTPDVVMTARSPYLLVYRRREVQIDGAQADSNMEMETD